MNEQSAYLVRAITGPVIMITVGVLFLLDRFADLRFHQTWPVLLIVIGLLQQSVLKVKTVKLKS